MLTKDLILKQFPHTAMISMVDAGNCIGLAKRTCYNLSSKKEFPLPVRKVRRKSMVALTDLIKYLENSEETFDEPVVPKRRAGRPTKGEQVRRERENAELS